MPTLTLIKYNIRIKRQNHEMNTKHKPFPQNSPCKVSTNNTDSIQAKFKCRHKNILQEDVLCMGMK